MQIIAREVEIQTMRRSAPKNATANNNTKSNKPEQRAKPKPQNHLQRLNTKGSGMKTKDLVCLISFLSLIAKKKTVKKNEHWRVLKSLLAI